ncbi:MAG: leucine-rich repeat domain-containing protein [Lepagella sp.]
MDKQHCITGGMLRTLAFCILVSAAVFFAEAKIFQADGIYYKTLTANTCEVTANATFSGDLVVPDSVVNSNVTYKVVAIGRGAFNKNSKVTSATLPSTITKIDEWAFSEASGLQRVNIPESVTVLGSSAFQGCTSLREVTVPSSIKSLKSFVFNLCENLTTVNLPEGLTTIGTAAFSSCYSLKTLKIPSTVTSIYSIAFWRAGLEKISLPAAIWSIGDGAFGACEKLTEISLSPYNGYYTVDNNILYNKDKSALLCCPAGLNLTSVTVDNSVTSIKQGALAFCTTLKEVILPPTLTEIAYDAFCNCTALAAIDIPASVSDIGKSAFEKCSSLKTFRFPAALKAVNGKTLYENLALVSVTLPDSLESMAAYAIANCASLREVYAPGKTPAALDPDLEPFFQLDMSAITLYVPKESVEAYKAAPVWKDFGKIQGHEFGGVASVGDTAVPVAYFDLQGRRISPDSKGMAIVKYSDNSVRKVVLK